MHAPLLPGHGTNPESFIRSTGEEWIASARLELDRLLSLYQRVSIVGLSMGGALASSLAAERDRVCALVLIAPYLGMPFGLAFLAGIHRIWGRVAGVIHSTSGRSILDPGEQRRNLGYGIVTAGLLNELAIVVRAGRHALPGVSAPTLILQSRHDSRIKPRVAEYVLETLGSKEKRLLWVANSGHILTVDYGRERVIAEVIMWFRSHETWREDERSGTAEPAAPVS